MVDVAPLQRKPTLLVVATQDYENKITKMKRWFGWNINA